MDKSGTRKSIHSPMSSQNVIVSHTLHSSGPQYKKAILSTAVVEVAYKSESFITCSAILDSGSSVNIMT